MISIDQREADYLIKNVKQRKLKVCSQRKRHGGKTYFVLGDDYASLRALAQLRDTTVKKILEYDAKYNL